MQRKSSSLRSKLVVVSVLFAACVLAAPAAMAHGHYRHHSNHTANIVGALVVGAVIGGVLISASQNHDNYYRGAYGYPARPYAPVGYNSYPAYPYHGGVSIGVVYSNGGGYYRGSRGYYRHGGYDHRGYRDNSRHSDGRYYQHRRH